MTRTAAALHRAQAHGIAFLTALGLSGALACSGSERSAPAPGAAGDLQAPSELDPAANAGGAGASGAASTVGAGGADQVPNGPGAGGADQVPSGPDAGGAAAGPSSTAGESCGTLVCSAFASCSAGNAPASCQCAPGLEGDGQRCSDVDECAVTPDVCGAHASCQNGFGSYRCECEEGYLWNGTSCEDRDECEEHPCDAAAACSNDGSAGFSCQCGAGTFGDGFFCNAADACAGDPCGGHGQCLNIPDSSGGGYACQCDAGFEGQTDCTPCGADLGVTDPGLRAAVNRQLGRDLDDASPIPLAALAGQTALDASGLQLTELSGLSCWPDLESLNLSNNPGFVLEQNAAELARLNRLSELHIDCTGSTNLEPLAAHPGLRVLSANAFGCATPTPLADASAAGSIPGLEFLDLRGQSLGSVAFLSGAKNLRTLWLGQNQLHSTAELSHLPLLSDLDLDSNQLNDLTGLEQLGQLQSLNVAYNQLSDLAPTRSLPLLSVINAGNNALASLPDWSGLAQLGEVDVNDNQLTSVGPLSALKQLDWLNLAGNQIDTLSPLLDASLRGTLIVTGNPLACAAEDQHLRALRARGVDVLGDCQP